MTNFGHDMQIGEQFYGSGLLYGHYHLDLQIRGPHGHAFWNYPSGMRMVEGHFNKGIRAHVWRWFSESGDVMRVHDYGDGEYQKKQYDIPFEADSCSPQTTIILDEEFNFRQWFWQPDRTVEEAISWWSSLDAISPWTLTPKFLPGNLFEVTTDEHHDLWNKSWFSGRYITGHIDEDYSSYLRRQSGQEGYPSGDYIRHKNFKYIEE